MQPPQLKCQEREQEGGKSSTFYSLKPFHSIDIYPPPIFWQHYLPFECKAVLGVLFLTLNPPHYEYFARFPSAILEHISILARKAIIAHWQVVYPVMFCW